MNCSRTFERCNAAVAVLGVAIGCHDHDRPTGPWCGTSALMEMQRKSNRDELLHSLIDHLIEQQQIADSKTATAQQKEDANSLIRNLILQLLEWRTMAGNYQVEDAGK